MTFVTVKSNLISYRLRGIQLKNYFLQISLFTAINFTFAYYLRIYFL